MKITMGESKKLVFFLPNTFTALNMACGFGSVLMSFQGSTYMACMLLVLGAVFDSVDGRIARITGTQSLFGEQFDSISDVVSFGFAPSILVYNQFFIGFGRLGMVISFIFLLCGALRLARFNANIDEVPSSYFQGLPIPCGALAIVGYVLLSLELPALKGITIFSAIYVLFYGLLMISNIPFCSFKKSKWIRTHKKMVLVIIFLLLSLLFIYESFMIIALVSLYVIGSLIHFIFNNGTVQGVFLWKNENEKKNNEV